MNLSSKLSYPKIMGNTESIRRLKNPVWIIDDKQKPREARTWGVQPRPCPKGSGVHYCGVSSFLTTFRSLSFLKSTVLGRKAVIS